MITEVRRVRHKVSFDGRLLKVTVADEVIDLVIREKFVKMDHVPLPDERWTPSYDLKATGLLRVCIEAPSLSPRTLWDESAEMPPERMIPKVLKGLSRAAVTIAAERLAQERRDAEYREQRRVDEELRARRAAERQYAEHLEGLVERWNRSRQVRAFLAALRDSRHDLGSPQGWPEGLAEWLRWVEQYADRLDPLVPAAGSLL